jgi:hypothetical protein
MSHLRTYLQPSHYYHNNSLNCSSKNIIKLGGKNLFDEFLNKNIILWKNQRNIRLLDYIQLSEGLSLRSYL